MQHLRDIYGYCILPKNTLLFRGHPDTSMNDCMFFATKKWVAGVFNQNVQIWKTTTDIELLFLVEHVKHNSWTISSLPHLYANIFPTVPVTISNLVLVLLLPTVPLPLVI